MRKPFFTPNITKKGRIVRGLMGAFMLVGARLAFRISPWAGLVMAIAAAFVVFEALRGWCLLRACGIKTKL